MQYTTKLSGEFYLGPFRPSTTAYMTLTPIFTDFSTHPPSCSVPHAIGTVFTSRG